MADPPPNKNKVEVKTDNQKLFLDMKQAMQARELSEVVARLRMVLGFVGKEQAYYPEALTQYIEMLEISVLRAAERVSMRNSDQIVDELMRVLDEYASTLLRFRPYFTAFKGLAERLDSAAERAHKFKPASPTPAALAKPGPVRLTPPNYVGPSTFQQQTSLSQSRPVPRVSAYNLQPRATAAVAQWQPSNATQPQQAQKHSNVRLQAFKGVVSPGSSGPQNSSWPPSVPVQQQVTPSTALYGQLLTRPADPKAPLQSYSTPPASSTGAGTPQPHCANPKPQSGSSLSNVVIPVARSIASVATPQQPLPSFRPRSDRLPMHSNNQTPNDPSTISSPVVMTSDARPALISSSFNSAERQIQSLHSQSVSSQTMGTSFTGMPITTGLHEVSPHSKPFSSPHIYKSPKTVLSDTAVTLSSAPIVTSPSAASASLASQGSQLISSADPVYAWDYWAKFEQEDDESSSDSGQDVAFPLPVDPPAKHSDVDELMEDGTGDTHLAAVANPIESGGQLPANMEVDRESITALQTIWHVPTALPLPASSQQTLPEFTSSSSLNPSPLFGRLRPIGDAQSFSEVKVIDHDESLASPASAKSISSELPHSEHFEVDASQEGRSSVEVSVQERDKLEAVGGDDELEEQIIARHPINSENLSPSTAEHQPFDPLESPVGVSPPGAKALHPPPNPLLSSASRTASEADHSQGEPMMASPSSMATPLNSPDVALEAPQDSSVHAVTVPTVESSERSIPSKGLETVSKPALASIAFKEGGTYNMPSPSSVKSLPPAPDVLTSSEPPTISPVLSEGEIQQAVPMKAAGFSIQTNEGQKVDLSDAHLYQEDPPSSFLKFMPSAPDDLSSTELGMHPVLSEGEIQEALPIKIPGLSIEMNESQKIDVIDEHPREGDKRPLSMNISALASVSESVENVNDPNSLVDNITVPESRAMRTTTPKSEISHEEVDECLGKVHDLLSPVQQLFDDNPGVFSAEKRQRQALHTPEQPVPEDDNRFNGASVTSDATRLPNASTIAAYRELLIPFIIAQEKLRGPSLRPEEELAIRESITDEQILDMVDAGKDLIFDAENLGLNLKMSQRANNQEDRGMFTSHDEVMDIVSESQGQEYTMNWDPLAPPEHSLNAVNESLPLNNSLSTQFAGIGLTEGPPSTSSGVQAVSFDPALTTAETLSSSTTLVADEPHSTIASRYPARVVRTLSSADYDSRNLTFDLTEDESSILRLWANREARLEPGDGALCLLLRCATNDTLAQDAAGAAVHGDHWPEHFMSLCLLDPNDSDNYILLSPPDHSTFSTEPSEPIDISRFARPGTNTLTLVFPTLEDVLGDRRIAVQLCRPHEDIVHEFVARTQQLDRMRDIVRRKFIVDEAKIQAIA